MAGLEVRRVANEAEAAALYAFRYQVYVQELGMTANADHERKWLRDAYDDHALNYAIFDGDGAVVGSLRAILMDRVPSLDPFVKKFDMAPALDAFGPGAIATTSRFMVAPELRDSMAAFRLMQDAFLESRDYGVRLNYGDCSPHLLPFYEQLGYRRYTGGFDDTDFGYKLPILMLVRDHEHFAKVRSPILRVVQKTEDDPEAREWFAATYPDFVDASSAMFLDNDTFFDLLTERLAGDPLHAVSLLRGLSAEQAAEFLSRATVVEAGPGDRIVRRGDRDNTLYVLLSGLAEVRPDGDTAKPPAAFVGAGDTFGEIGFLTTVGRTADVVARTDCEVLVLSGAFLNRLLETEPAIGARVLQNLARELAGRLATTTKARSTL